MGPRSGPRTAPRESISIIDTATNTQTAVLPVGATVAGIVILTKPQAAPTDKDQCKNGGWQTFTTPSFKNQGECIKYVNSL